MAKAEKHPHQDDPTHDQIRGALEKHADNVVELYLAVHDLVLETLPGTNSSIDLVDGMTGYGFHQYGYGGWGIAALGAHTKWVSLHFMYGVELADDAGILEGSGKQLRHVKLRTTEQLEEHREAIKELVLQAAQLRQ